MNNYEHRKARKNIIITDVDGKPASGRQVIVKLENHKFLFGCGLRMRVDLVDKMLGNGDLVQQKNFFPSSEEDSGYRILLKREQIAPFGNPKCKSKKDKPSLFPYSTFQHYIEK